VVGEIFDVAVDLRQSSPTFGQSVGALLSASNHQQLWVPVGFAHGFMTLSDQAEVLYKASHFWSKACERSLLWNDPALGIDWPLDRLGDQEASLAAKDAEAPTLAELASRGELL
jgi:dTDP-4-dehydrorhamnose 3,5-epimerase